MKRKSVILLLVCLLLLAGVCLLFLYPRPLIKTPYQISDVIRSDTDILIGKIRYDGEFVTEKVDLDQLLEILSRYSCRFGLTPLQNYALKDTLEVDLNQGGQSLHIVLGERSVCYSGNRIYWTIIDSAQLKAELCSLLTP